MQRERTAGAARRSARTRRRAIWLVGGVAALAVLAGVAVIGGPGGPPPSRPPGAGLPPTMPRPASMAGLPAPVTGLGAEIEEEEARLAALRAARARLEQEVAALRLEAEERRRTMPGQKNIPEGLASGPTPPGTGAAGGGPVLTVPAIAAAPAQPERPLRIFVHHRANSRPAAGAAEEVAQTLRGAGVEVTAVRGAPFVPSTPVVRYFHEEDEAAAAQLAARLGRGWATQDFRAFIPQPPPATLEVWLPAN